MGLGTYGYQFFSPQMMSEEYLSRGYRAVHSMYFECLVERGYHGFIIFACLVVSNFRFLRKVRNYLAERREQTLYYQALAIESAFIGFLVSSLFVDRLHSEMLYWCMLFIACFGRIYLRKMEAEETD